MDYEIHQASSRAFDRAIDAAPGSLTELFYVVDSERLYTLYALAFPFDPARSCSLAGVLRTVANERDRHAAAGTRQPAPAAAPRLRYGMASFMWEWGAHQHERSLARRKNVHPHQTYWIETTGRALACAFAAFKLGWQ